MQHRITNALAFPIAAAVSMFLLSGPVHAQGVLNANSAHAVLCSMAACPGTTPVISGLDPASVVSPGGKLVLKGTSFNSSSGQSGEIVLKVGSKYPLTIIQLGSPNAVFHQPYVERHLTILGWADSHAFAQIPSDITGVMDGPATVEIWRNDGAKSNAFAVRFTATRDLQILPLNDVTLQACEATADANLCNHSSDSVQLTVPVNVAGFVTFSIFGQHTMFIPNSNQFQVQGVDKYSFDLKNGWVLDNSKALENGIGSSYGCSVDAPTQENFQNSKPNYSAPSTSSVLVAWHAGCGTKYAIALHITGPTGVPWK